MLRTQLAVHTDEVVLAVETFGDNADRPVVLSMGANASMVWWPESLCVSLAEHGYFVIRYDHRDTGRSTTGAPGAVTYSAEDMAADLVGILDHLDVRSAHLVGMSLGGYLSQIVAVSRPERVWTLTLIASEPLGAEEGSLPGIDDRFMTHFATLGDIDWADTEDVAGFLVEIGRLCAGRPERFDEAGARQRVAVEIERASNIASSLNHGMVTVTQDWSGAATRITQPTLVIHGALDPILPLPNGRALADLIPDSRLLVLPDAGHELNTADIDDIAAAIIDFITDADGP
jgi:pimeloyl-ACP methyl ester carboxylesterase